MKNKFLLIASVFVLISAAGTNANAQWVKTNAQFGAQTLISFGTDIFAGVAGDGGGGGVYGSSDSGKTWELGGTLATAVYALAKIGTNLFAGTYAYGVFRSTDSGATWKSASTGLPDKWVTCFAVSGTNLFAGGSGPTCLTTNYGDSWTPLNDSGGASGASALVISGTNLFAGMGESVFLSTDSGNSWISRDSGLLDKLVYALAADGPILYVGTENYGVLQSIDSGGSWTPSSNGMGNYSILTISVVGTNLYAGTEQGKIFMSADSGKNWTQTLSTTTSDFNAFAMCGDYLYAGNLGEIWRTLIPTSEVSIPQSIISKLQSYPNPFTQSTTIRFTSAESGVARVTVVNLLGEEVARVFEGALTSGEHSFTWSKPAGLPSGIYECVVEMNGSTQQVPVVVSP